MVADVLSPFPVPVPGLQGGQVRSDLHAELMAHLAQVRLVPGDVLPNRVDDRPDVPGLIDRLQHGLVQAGDLRPPFGAHRDQQLVGERQFLLH